MDVRLFDFELPKECIASEPARPRDAARMMRVLRDPAVDPRHLTIRDLPECLEPGDLLVANDTRVLPARLFGARRTGAKVELLLTTPEDEPGVWRALLRPAAKIKVGEVLELADGQVTATAQERLVDPEDPTQLGPEWRVHLDLPDGGNLIAALESFGRMPLPPYIERARDGDPRASADREDYQTVYAKELGAVAAPTAGLHFTAELLEALKERGVGWTTVTLHVGLGTFRPVTAEDTAQHRMHSERYVLSAETVAAVHATRIRGGRVIAVGTTSVRVLESCCDAAGQLHAGSGETDIFIEPGYRMRAVDGLLTNFHLPKSTLLMLVSSMTGRERLLELYREAIERDYRFYSYGDAMLVL